MLERLLRWASITSLTVLVVLLAIQLAPRFIERAKANGPLPQSEQLGEPIDADLDLTASPKLFTDSEAEAAERSVHAADAAADGADVGKKKKWWNRRLLAKADAREEAPDAPFSSRRTAHDSARARIAPPASSFVEDVEQRQQLIETLQEGATRDFESNYDEQPGDLPERHDGDRFDVVRSDLPERHEALLTERTTPRVERRRYDVQDADLATRHEALPNPQPFARLDADKLGPHVEWFANRYGDNEKEAADTDVQRYYLVPVPRD